MLTAYSWLICINTTANPSTVHAQRITHTTLLEGNVACAGDMVVITCVTEGPAGHGMIWSGEYYVGRGGNEISFTTDDNISQRRNTIGNEDTFAMLTGKNTVNNQIRLTSELHIMASVSTSTASSGSVTCRRIDEDQEDTQRFQVFGKQCVTCLYSN